MWLENQKLVDIVSIDAGQPQQEMVKIIGEMFIIPENQYSLQLSIPEDIYLWEKSPKFSLEKTENTVSN